MPHGCNPTARPGAALMPCGETSGAVRACQGPGLIQELWLPLLRGLFLPQLAGPSWGRAIGTQWGHSSHPKERRRREPPGPGHPQFSQPRGAAGKGYSSTCGQQFPQVPTVLCPKGFPDACWRWGWAFLTLFMMGVESTWCLTSSQPLLQWTYPAFLGFLLCPRLNPFLQPFFTCCLGVFVS